MLVKFVIDAHSDSWENSVASTSSGSISAAHRLFLNDWQPVGILCFINRKSKEELDARIKDLPPTLRKLWKNAVHPRKTRHKVSLQYLSDDGELSDFVWQSVRCVENLDSSLKKADVMVVGNAVRADDFGVEDNAGAYTKTIPNLDIEICPMSSLQLTSNFQAARLLGGKQIEIEEYVDSVWEQRFARLVEYSTNVVLGDAHSLKEHNSRDPITLESFSRHGLYRLIMELDRSPGPPKNLQIYTREVRERDPEQRITDVLDIIGEFSSSLFQKGNLRMITVTEVPYRLMSQASHGRFLRFDSTWCEIDRGLEILSGDKVRNASSFYAVPFNSDKKKREKQLRSRTPMNEFEIDKIGWRYKTKDDHLVRV